jgi:phosphatidylglycerol lysyltransferase
MTAPREVPNAEEVPDYADEAEHAHTAAVARFEEESDGPVEPKKKVSHLGTFAAFFSGAMFVVAVIVLYETLKRYSLDQITSHFADLTWAEIVRAGILTVLGYFVLTFYDVLALQHVRRHVRYLKVALASFIGFAFAHNMGMAPLTGGSVRLRIYSEEGLTANEIATIIMFCTLTFSLGVTAAGAALFFVIPPELLDNIYVPHFVARPLAALLLLALLGYVYLTWKVRRPIRVFGWHFHLPTLRSTILQILLAVVDLSIAGSVLYVLLPGEVTLPLPVFLAVYMVAMLIGMLSHVPGGLGVFEALVVLMLPDAPPDAVFGALLAYRITYYIVPFAIAAATLGIREAIKSHHYSRRRRTARR